MTRRVIESFSCGQNLSKNVLPNTIWEHDLIDVTAQTRIDVAMRETVRHVNVIPESGTTSQNYIRATAIDQRCVVVVFLTYFVSVMVLCASYPQYCYDEMKSYCTSKNSSEVRLFLKPTIDSNTQQIRSDSRNYVTKIGKRYAEDDLLGAS